MNYIKIKNKLNQILPKFIFTFIIYIWRNTYIIYIKLKWNFNARKFKKPFFKKIKISNIKFYLKINPNNWFIDKEIFIYNIYEKSIYLLMKNIIKKWDVCVDIWANIGMYTNFFPQIIWKRWKVIAFEPINRIYKQNNESIIKNNYSNIKLYNNACSNKKEKLYIYIDKENIWWSTINPTNNTEKELIETVIWDNILLKENRIDFIKIDTEWYELNVLTWIIKTIKKFKPKIIIEFSPKLFLDKNDWSKILNLLKKYYKSVYIIEYNRKLDLNKKNDLIVFNNLINEVQVNLYFK